MVWLLVWVSVPLAGKECWLVDDGVYDGVANGVGDGEGEGEGKGEVNVDGVGGSECGEGEGDKGVRAPVW